MSSLRNYFVVVVLFLFLLLKYVMVRGKNANFMKTILFNFSQIFFNIAFYSNTIFPTAVFGFYTK